MLGRLIIVSLLGLFLLLAGLVVALVPFFIATEYRPKAEEVVFRSSAPTPLPDTLTVLTWNIGYAGLGDNMDFFYDGGRRVRDSRERTVLNLAHIIAAIRRANADIVLLQEVDSGSHRTYGIDEVDILRRALPGYTLAFGYNYNAVWVPVPLRDPMGRVRSGMVILSRAVPLSVVRYQYPSAFPFPVRMFNLKRGLLAAEFLTADGDTLMIGNTHNTAYDTGNMRQQEMIFLHGLLERKRQSGVRTVIGGDWNQHPPLYIPLEAELTNPYFVPQPIPRTLFDESWQFTYDTASHSLRFLDRPYDPAASVTTLTDFFLLPADFEVLSIETLPEQFHASDHDPVLMRVVIPSAVR